MIEIKNHKFRKRWIIIPALIVIGILFIQYAGFLFFSSTPVNNITAEMWQNILYSIMGIWVASWLIIVYFSERKIEELEVEEKVLIEKNKQGVTPSVQPEIVSEPQMIKQDKELPEDAQFNKINKVSEERRKQWERELGRATEEEPLIEGSEGSENSTVKKVQTKEELIAELERMKIMRQIMQEKTLMKDMKDGRIVIEPEDTATKDIAEIKFKLKRVNDGKDVPSEVDDLERPPIVDRDD